MLPQAAITTSARQPSGSPRKPVLQTLPLSAVVEDREESAHRGAVLTLSIHSGSLPSATADIYIRSASQARRGAGD